MLPSEYLSVLQVLVPTEALVAWCQEQKSGRRLGKNFKRRKDFLRDLEMLPDGFPATWEDPLPDNLITATQVTAQHLPSPQRSIQAILICKGPFTSQ